MSSYQGHLVDHIRKPELLSDSTLHVIGVVSNSERFHSRYRLARDWLAQIETAPHVKAYLVETAFGDRQHEIAEPDNARHLRLRTKTSAWQKESMINLGVRELLPTSWRYVAWVDTDILFRHEQWALEAMHQLQHFAVIQPWQSCADLGPEGEIMSTFTSFGKRVQEGHKTLQAGKNDPYVYGHSGYAWACRRDFWERVGGLIDYAVLGSGDHHMAFAMVGQGERTVNSGLGPSYLRKLKEWQDRALQLTHGEVGYSAGRIEHSFHGPKAGRGYQSRWKILVDAKFDPDTDLIHDEQGLIRIAPHRAELDIAIRKYNRSRREDSIERE